jgi:hypothetical protein
MCDLSVRIKIAALVAWDKKRQLDKRRKNSKIGRATRWRRNPGKYIRKRKYKKIIDLVSKKLNVVIRQ